MDLQLSYSFACHPQRLRRVETYQTAVGPHRSSRSKSHARTYAPQSATPVHYPDPEYSPEYLAWKRQPGCEAAGFMRLAMVHALVFKRRLRSMAAKVRCTLTPHLEGTECLAVRQIEPLLRR